MIVTARAMRFIPRPCRRMFNLKARCRFKGRDVIVPAGINDARQNVRWHCSWRSHLFECLIDPSRGAFIDVGVNIGQTLLDIVLTKPRMRYVGFEPNPACLSYLSEFIKANDFEQCLIAPIALSAEAGLSPLFKVPGNATNSSATLIGDLRPARGQLDRAVVPCFPFDQVWPALGGGSVAFVKIDVEGAELGVLRGMNAALAADRPLVLCEVLFAAVRADLPGISARNEQLMALLRSLDYRVFQLIKDRVNLKNLKEIERFPIARWSTENADLCDYLLVPEEYESMHLLEGLIAP